MRRLRRGAAVAALLAILPPAAAAAPVEVALREHPATDSWQVTYRFAEAVRGVLFQRPRRGPTRQSGWQVLSPGVVWTEREGREALVAPRPVTAISLLLASDFEPRVKGYELNLSFTDGGRLLYTGDLSVVPLLVAADGALVRGEVPDHLWRLESDAERWIAVPGDSGRGRLDWREPAAGTGNGTYAYFGPRPPARSPRVSFVVDPGLPEWMRQRAEWALPRLIDLFAAETGVELAFRPLVLISYRPEDISGLVHSGGTLDGLVQMAAIGDGWRQQTAEAEAMWLDRTAHEIFHFWTGQMYVAVLGGGDAWLTEGGADLFAKRAMLALGSIDRSTYERRLVEAANDCLVGLAGRPLLAAAAAGTFRDLYSCGSTLWLWAGAAVGQATGSDDGTADFVRELLAGSADRRLTSYRFLETLHRLTGGPEAGAPLARVLLHGVGEAADELMLQQMLAAGLPVRLAPAAEATLAPATRPPGAPHPSWSRLLALQDR